METRVDNVDNEHYCYYIIVFADMYIVYKVGRKKGSGFLETKIYSVLRNKM
jgi:hypothetical protein